MLDWWAAIHWASPWFLVLLPVVPAVALTAWRRGRPGLRLSRVPPVAGRSKHPGILALPLVLQALGLLALVLAMARPQRGLEFSRRRPKGIDIVIAMDVSGSMEAVDIPRRYQQKEELETLIARVNSADPNVRRRAEVELQKALKLEEIPSRLQIARKEIGEFVAGRPNDRIGLVTFASDAFTLCPPTLDHDFLTARLKNVKSGILGDTSTRLAPPIAAAVSRLKDSDADRRVMLLLTDGENMRPWKITPRQAAQMARDFKITIHAIGIGSRYGFYSPDRNMFGQANWIRIDQFNPELIKDIATETGGLYFAAEDDEGMARIMGEIDKIERTPRDQARYTDYKELFPYFVIAGFALILIGFILDHTVFLRVP